MQVKLWRDGNPLTKPALGSRNHLLSQFDDMFNQLMDPSAWTDAGTDFLPAYDIQETADRYLLSFDIPGVDSKDLDIEVEGNRLRVSGERKGDSERAVFARCRSRSGRFQQVFTIPDGVNAEAVEACHKDGVLTLTIQKPAAARAIKIKIGDGFGKEGSAKSRFLNSLVGDKKASKELLVEMKQEPVALAN